MRDLRYIIDLTHTFSENKYTAPVAYAFEHGRTHRSVSLSHEDIKDLCLIMGHNPYDLCRESLEILHNDIYEDEDADRDGRVFVRPLPEHMERTLDDVKNYTKD